MDIQVISAPYDSGQKMMRTGLGPSRLADAGDAALRGAGFSVAVETIDLGEQFPVEVGLTFKQHVEVSKRVSEARRAGRFPLVLAGNCAVASMGTLAAFSDTGIGVAWFDAHGEFNTPETSLSGFLDGMGLAVITGRCWQAIAATIPGFRPLEENRILLVGGRDFDQQEGVALRDSAIRLIAAEQIAEQGVDGALGRGLDEIGSEAQQLYLHIDLDILDPSEGQANAFAAPGGLSLAEVLAGIELIGARIPVVAAGIASYDPEFDTDDRVRRAAVAIMEKIASVGKIRG